MNSFSCNTSPYFKDADLSCSVQAELPYRFYFWPIQIFLPPSRFFHLKFVVWSTVVLSYCSLSDDASVGIFPRLAQLFGNCLANVTLKHFHLQCCWHRENDAIPLLYFIFSFAFTLNADDFCVFLYPIISGGESFGFKALGELLSCWLMYWV